MSFCFQFGLLFSYNDDTNFHFFSKWGFTRLKRQSVKKLESENIFFPFSALRRALKHLNSASHD